MNKIKSLDQCISVEANSLNDASKLAINFEFKTAIMERLMAFASSLKLLGIPSGMTSS